MGDLAAISNEMGFRYARELHRSGNGIAASAAAFGEDPGRLDYLTANAPGATPDAFSATVSAAARARASRIGMGRAQTFLTGLPGLGETSGVSAGSRARAAGLLGDDDRADLRRSRVSARAGLSLFGDL